MSQPTIETYSKLSKDETAALSYLLALSMGNPSDDAIEKALGAYAGSSGQKLFYSRSGQVLTGCIGLKSLGGEKFEICHLAVARDLRKKGLGKLLVEDSIRRLRAGELFAETDGDSLDFYLRLGFVVVETKPNQWGLKRFHLKRAVAAI